MYQHLTGPYAIHHPYLPNKGMLDMTIRAWICESSSNGSARMSLVIMQKHYEPWARMKQSKSIQFVNQSLGRQRLHNRLTFGSIHWAILFRGELKGTGVMRSGRERELWSKHWESDWGIGSINKQTYTHVTCQHVTYSADLATLECCFRAIYESLEGLVGIPS